jgi:hypothetical protein
MYPTSKLLASVSEEIPVPNLRNYYDHYLKWNHHHPDHYHRILLFLVLGPGLGLLHFLVLLHTRVWSES